MRLRYRAAIFDLDGTLIDSARDLVESVVYALGCVDGREPPDGDTIIMEIGKPLETILRHLGYPSDEASTRQFVENYRRHFADHFPHHTRVFPGVHETLAVLRDAGVRLALVTTKHQTQAEHAVRKTGLDGYFHYLHGWSEGRRHKPHPEPVETALGKLGVPAAEAIVIGDTEQDIESAKAAGVATCAVAYGFRPVLMLRALRPDFLVARFSDIAHIVIAA